MCYIFLTPAFIVGYGTYGLNDQQCNYLLCSLLYLNSHPPFFQCHPQLVNNNWSPVWYMCFKRSAAHLFVCYFQRTLEHIFLLQPQFLSPTAVDKKNKECNPQFVDHNWVPVWYMCFKLRVCLLFAISRDPCNIISTWASIFILIEMDKKTDT